LDLLMQFAKSAVATTLTGLVLAFLPLCSAAQTSDDATPLIRVAGPRAITSALIPATLESFARENDLTLRREIHGDDAFALALVDGGAAYVARFEFHDATSAQALAALAEGRVEIAATNRAADPEEETALGDGAAAQLVARDALVAIVARPNELVRIAPEELARALAGEITDWSELGGPQGPISIHIPEPNSGLGVAVANLLPDAAGFGGNIRTYDTDTDLADAVADDPGALGVTRFSEVGNARALALRGVCSIVNEPTNVSI
jgi:phosphate transport system substrate-binding protein